MTGAGCLPELRKVMSHSASIFSLLSIPGIWDERCGNSESAFNPNHNIDQNLFKTFKGWKKTKPTFSIKL